MIHEPNTFQITTAMPPVLQGCKSKGLWTVTVNNTEQVGLRQKMNNVYNIPSTRESVRYLHAATGFPVQETWIDAIKAGNYTTWLGMNVNRIGGDTNRPYEKATAKCQINESKRDNNSR